MFYLSLHFHVLNLFFRVVLCMKKKGYPSYEEVVDSMIKTEVFEQEVHVPVQMPGHTLLILPPIIISNLLPFDLQYYFKVFWTIYGLYKFSCHIKNKMLYS